MVIHGGLWDCHLNCLELSVTRFLRRAVCSVCGKLSGGYQLQAAGIICHDCTRTGLEWLAFENLLDRNPFALLLGYKTGSLVNGYTAHTGFDDPSIAYQLFNGGQSCDDSVKRHGRYPLTGPYKYANITPHFNSTRDAESTDGQ